MKEKQIRVIVACEESQAVCSAFRKLGHEAFSCDILPCSGGHPEWHFQEDIFKVLEREPKFDLMIAHPPCTFLTVTWNRWFNEEKYGEKAIKRKKDREDAINFFISLSKMDIPYIAIENPIGIMSTVYRKPDQIVQPYMFGDEAQKSTCLWLKNLPLLKPTHIVGKGEIIKFKSGKSMPKWYAEAFYKCKTKEERSTLRSKTFQGIANAMAQQWSDFIIEYSELANLCHEQ